MNSIKIFKKFKWIAIVILYLSPMQSAFCLNKIAPPGKLVFDEKEDLTLPRNFRLMSSPFVIQSDEKTSRQGLDSLPVSASAQFSQKTFTQARKKMQGKVWIIDLRREPHGFLNGRPISWYAVQNQSNLDMDTQDLEKTEHTLFKQFKKRTPVSVYDILGKENGHITKSRSNTMVVNVVQTESEFAKANKTNYLRMPVSDHQRPTDAQVDEFVSFYQSLPKNAWLHFHCRAGKGRTTTFLTMVDMMENAKAVSIHDITQRQYQLGGADLMNISQDEKDEWKADWALQRKSFLELFYHYAKSEDFPAMSWSAWLQKHSTLHEESD